jgi:mannose/cellobiose epimerase-like protein (N-acyl-D-glucosamine 2-epimerase family)
MPGLRPDYRPREDDLSLWSEAFRVWTFEKALPFWAVRGVDATPGRGFCEHLLLDGAAADVPYKRLRVQARQIYVFSHASLLGWSGGLAVAKVGYDFIVRHGRLSNGAWARRLGCDGAVLDTAADLYDLAFILFALAWYARASASQEALDLATDTLEWVLAEMRHPSGGFYNVLPHEPAPRQQNPHMHLLEAVLALYETSPQPLFLDVAHELVQLFHRHFFDPATGTLGEFFDANLTPCAGDAGDHVEPGHHYEWVWLLSEYEKISGVSLLPQKRALYHFAENHGVDRTTGAILDVVGRDGRVLSASRRLWPQTEAIKAHLTMLTESQNAPLRLQQCLENILVRHFNDCPAGTWREHFDLSGQPLVDKIPSSSFYHVFMAFGELSRSLS